MRLREVGGSKISISLLTTKDAERHTFSRYLATERKTKASGAKNLGQHYALNKDLRVLATQSMEPIFLQSAFLGDVLVNRVACNVERYGAVKCCIKVSNSIGIGKCFDARFDDGQGRTIVSTQRLISTS
jgi:hypothetical protein